MKMGVFVSDYKLSVDTLNRLKSEKLGIIFVGNGVYHASVKENNASSALLGKTTNLYCLSDDVQTRGIQESEIDKRVKLVDYSGLVDIIFKEFDKIVWL